jgi:hypothetical protein
MTNNSSSTTESNKCPPSLSKYDFQNPPYISTLLNIEKGGIMYGKAIAQQSY